MFSTISLSMKEHFRFNPLRFQLSHGPCKTTHPGNQSWQHQVRICLTLLHNSLLDFRARICAQQSQCSMHSSKFAVICSSTSTIILSSLQMQHQNAHGSAVLLTAVKIGCVFIDGTVVAESGQLMLHDVTTSVRHVHKANAKDMFAGSSWWGRCFGVEHTRPEITKQSKELTVVRRKQLFAALWSCHICIYTVKQHRHFHHLVQSQRCI